VKSSECISNSLIEYIIDEWIQGDLNRKIMKDRHINLMCYEPLAEKYDISVSTVKRILNKHNDIFFRKIDEELKKQKKEEQNVFSIIAPELIGI
jgi:uncharacterized protein YjcR